MNKIITQTGKVVNDNPDALLNKMRLDAEKNDERQAFAKKRADFCGKAIRHDDCREDEDGHPMENTALSDRGRGAAVIRSLGKEPLWLRLFNRAYDALDAQDKEIVDALFVDMRPAVAARIANTNRQRVYRVIARFRELLIPAFREWKSW